MIRIALEAPKYIDGTITIEMTDKAYDTFKNGISCGFMGKISLSDLENFGVKIGKPKYIGDTKND